MMGLPWTVALLASTLWIIYRVYLIFQKPVEELEEVLGVDIPPTPDVTLSTITDTTIVLFWKPPENYHSPMDRYIQVNGIRIGPIHRTNQTVSLTGLEPGNHYSIRAIGANGAGNSTYSHFIQVQTSPSDGHKGSQLLADLDQDQGTLAHSRSSSITTTSKAETLVASKEPSEEEADDTVVNLKKKLDALRRQRDEAARQLAQDSEEAENTKAALLKERDELKEVVEEKDRASLEFRKQVNELEKQCKASQRRKSTKERAVQQKKAERQKMKDDVARWSAEISEIRSGADALRREKRGLEAAHLDKMAETQKLIHEAHAQSRTLEEEIQDWGKKIKVLEDERKKAHQEQTQEEQEVEKREKEDEQIHDLKIQDLQARYTALWKLNSQAEAESQQAQDRLSYLLEVRQQDPGKFAPMPYSEYSYSAYGAQQRRSRQGGPRHSSSSYPSGSFSGGHGGFHSISSISPSFASAFPFYNANSSISSTNEMGLSQQETEQLTGGALMSPTANNLLPSDLLGDDEAPSPQYGHPARHAEGLAINPYADQGNQAPQSPLSAHSQSPSLLSSPRDSINNFNIYHSGQDQAHDADRRSIRSIASASSPYNLTIPVVNAAGNSRRMSSLFGFNKQRGKSSVSELPQLGSLKSNQSQSYPTNLEEPGSGGSGRRKLSAGGWPNPLPFLRGQGSPNASGDASPGLRNAFPRRTRRGVFGNKIDAPPGLGSIDQHSPSRPSSTYSFDNAAPRSSSDNMPFGWGAQGRQRTSIHGADWTSGHTPWMGTRSRRQSLQLGSTSNLSVGSTPLEPEELKPAAQPAPIGTERFRFLSQKKAAGTPDKNEKRATAITEAPPPPLPPPAPAKLNPAAPSFTTRLFHRTSTDSRRATKSDKSDTAASDRTSEPPAGGSGGARKGGGPASASDESPPLSRRSRDTSRSIATTASLAESSDNLPADAPPAAATPPAPAAGSSAPRESFMSRLTRKSSSGKFPTPWKDRAAAAAAAAAGTGSDSNASGAGGSGSVRARFGKKGATGVEPPTTPGESDENAGDDMGSGGGGGGGEVKTPGGSEKAGRTSLTWSRVMGKGKARRGEAGEAEGTATTASMTEEED